MISLGGAEDDVVDGPRVQVHQLWPGVSHPRGLLHQTGETDSRRPLSIWLAFARPPPDG